MTRPANPELPDKILDAAESIVVNKGQPALNMRALAEAISITSTTLYYYFKSKEHILSRIKLRIARRLNEQVRRIQPGNFEAAFRELAGIYIEFAEKSPALYRIFVEQIFDRTLLTEEEYQEVHYSYHAAEKSLKAMAAAGLYHQDPKQGAMKGWIQLHGFVSLLIGGTMERVTGLSRSRLKSMFMDIYMAG
jgi:AcrR family transcriptional regulator